MTLQNFGDSESCCYMLSNSLLAYKMYTVKRTQIILFKRLDLPFLKDATRIHGQGQFLTTSSIGSSKGSPYSHVWESPSLFASTYFSIAAMFHLKPSMGLRVPAQPNCDMVDN